MKLPTMSYSALDVWKQSQLWFYFWKIAEANISDLIIESYGQAGNVVHKALQDYLEKKEKTFDYHWNRMTDHRKVIKQEYQSMYERGMEHLHQIKQQPGALSVKAEDRIVWDFHGLELKVFIDLIVHKKDSIVVYDWKTNKSASWDTHHLQRIFTAMMVYFKYGKIPDCHWIYLRNNVVYSEKPSMADIQGLMVELNTFKKDIERKGLNIAMYEPGNIASPFNPYLSLCKHEINRRSKDEGLQCTLIIKGMRVYISGYFPQLLEKGIDKRLSFDLQNKHWIQQHAKKNRKGIIDLKDVGTMHMYNRRDKSFPIGCMRKVKDIIKEYEEYTGNKINLKIIDQRNKDISFTDMPFKLQTDMTFRDYQLEAIERFEKTGEGILQLPTGSGKTFIAAELIRRYTRKTLWIIDRKELFEQTRETLSNLLGVSIGEIGSGRDRPAMVTIATTQSLLSNLDRHKEFLSTIDMIVVDEYHKSAAETYQTILSYLPKARIRLGLTATPMRDDGKEPLLFAYIGEVIYKVEAHELIDKGYLILPDIRFFVVPHSFRSDYDTYADEYKNVIVENEHRNDMIVKLVSENPVKTVILVKQVAHGRELYERLTEKYPEKYVYHVHGMMGKTKRMTIMEWFRAESRGILIMTLSIGAEGLDFPDLMCVINAAANKGDVKSLQVLGRVLRICQGKKDAQYIDFMDCGKYTHKHSLARKDIFEKQGYTVEVVR